MTASDGSRHFENSPVFLRDFLEGSLARLGVDHVPLYYIHRRDQRFPIEAVMETLLRFKEEGKIGGIGFSEISPNSLRRAAKVGPVMAVQSEYSLWTRMPDLGMIQACKEVGAAFVAFSPVARGMLADVGIWTRRTSVNRNIRPEWAAVSAGELCGEYGVYPRVSGSGGRGRGADGGSGDGVGSGSGRACYSDPRHRQAGSS